MKTLLSILFMLCLVTAFAQGPTMTSDYLASASSRIHLSSNKNISQLNSMYKRSRESEADKCDRYQNKMITGTTLTALGGAMLITGVVMITVGQSKASTYNTQYGYYTNNNKGEGLVVGGSVIVGGAVPVILIGTPFMIVGIIKSKKYCHSANYPDKPIGGESSYMQLGTNGNGLVLNF